MIPNNHLADRLAAQFSPPYQGEIWDNCARFKLIGKGYESMLEAVLALAAAGTTLTA